MDIDGNAIGSVLYVQINGDMSPMPMAILTKGQWFFGMEIYTGSEQVRKDEEGDIVEIIFLALGRRGDQEYFRWLKEGEEAQLKCLSEYYEVRDILRIVPGR